ncbi:DNA-protecting protein DprA [Pseudoclavibacter chungangensis]|uniref:DNA-protecting protein DprA n=1 Tax=Pseudoclavibacter chungangensis TaxID=587635 RepID=A0A7J5BZ01_9MICO|nr:DNA-processing protein DprA [Pseudoclavibacter chungangensis]KAB1659573.1 DNA-protecting protein DprA [Pseudoclavibacter chungangensis]NYJ67393.1 DNA processing protein [Pseudoclavibacter chungangensis]
MPTSLGEGARTGAPELHSEHELVRRVVARTAPDVDDDGIRRRELLVAWSAIAPSGDRDAAVLMRLCGADRALAAVRADDPVPRIAALVRASAGEDPIAAAELLERLPAAFRRWRDRLAPARVRDALRAARAFDVHLLVAGDPDWPPTLDDLGDHAPLTLWVRGDPSALRRTERSVAIVGSRAATPAGIATATELASGAVGAKFSVVSGGAYGIDAAAHRGALTEGETVAVMAGGVDRLYPAGNQELLRRIVERAAVVAEVPCGEAPTRSRFLERNRLIAALGTATVVVEAGKRSGAANTAGHAAALGRPLGAVPGPVKREMSEGCHELIREAGAILVRNDKDLLELATPGFVTPGRRRPSGDPAE